jgi:phosphoribosylformylglycinamidine cyclo-ligase
MNDIITSGAKPLFFLDYIATGKLDKKQLLRVVQGISHGCGENNCSLLGGETAEMPGFYSKNKYDLAGFCVGIVDEDKLINGKKVSENDLIIALKSNGVHSNGFSLVRKIIQNNNQIEKEFEKVSHLSFYDELLKPTKIYNNVINQMLSENIEIKAMSHITGGGIPENLPRCIPSDFIPYINTSSWEIPILFKFLKEKGSIPEKDFWNTFNLGVGFCLIIDKQFKDAILSICEDHDIDSWEIGKIVRKNNSTISKFLPEILT